jgi:hypothetical protein
VFNVEQVDGLTEHYYAWPKIRCLRPSASKRPSIFWPQWVRRSSTGGHLASGGGDYRCTCSTDH